MATQPIALFELNPDLDRAAAAAEFAATGRVQIRDFLTAPAAGTIHRVLSCETPWGMAWRAGADGPHALRRQQVATTPPEESKRWLDAIGAAMRGGDYAFLYAQFP